METREEKRSTARVTDLDLRALIWASATDCGNRAMRAAGRTAWNEDDYNTARAEAIRLFAIAEPVE